MKKQPTMNADQLWNAAWTYIRTVVDTLREPFLILDEQLRVLSANRIFYTFFHTTRAKTEGELVYQIGNGEWNIPTLKILLEDILPKNRFFKDFRVSHNFPTIGKRIMILNARRVYTKGLTKPIMLLAMEDITTQIRLENQLKDYTKKLTQEIAKRTAELEVRVKQLEKLNKRISVSKERTVQKKSH